MEDEKPKQSTHTIRVAARPRPGQAHNNYFIQAGGVGVALPMPGDGRLAFTKIDGVSDEEVAHLKTDVFIALEVDGEKVTSTETAVFGADGKALVFPSVPLPQTPEEVAELEPPKDPGGFFKSKKGGR